MLKLVYSIHYSAPTSRLEIFLVHKHLKSNEYFYLYYVYYSDSIFTSSWLHSWNYFDPELFIRVLHHSLRSQLNLY